jgi:tricorn protease
VEKGGCTNLTDSPYTIEEYPSWSPDSRKIAYYSGSSNEGYYTWVMDADGKNKTRLYQSGGPPSWAPDGKGLIFTNRLNVYEILIIDANGKNARSLIKTEDIRISSPMWLND